MTTRKKDDPSKKRQGRGSFLGKARKVMERTRKRPPKG